MIIFILIFVYLLSFNTSLNFNSDSKINFAPTDQQENHIFSSMYFSGGREYAKCEKCGYSKYVGDSPIVGY